MLAASKIGTADKELKVPLLRVRTTQKVLLRRKPKLWWTSDVKASLRFVVGPRPLGKRHLGQHIGASGNRDRDCWPRLTGELGSSGGVDPLRHRPQNPRSCLARTRAWRAACGSVLGHTEHSTFDLTEAHWPRSDQVTDSVAEVVQLRL